MSKTHATISDRESSATWAIRNFAEVGPTLHSIRNETPRGFDYRQQPFKPMTRDELAMRINSKLHKNELPITIFIIRNLESGKLVYGGYMMRIHQVARALRLKIEITR